MIIFIIQVHIPRRMSGQSFVTKMKCQVTSNKTHHVLISKEISWKSFKEVCSGEPRKVNLGYNNEDWILKVENNTMLEKPDSCSVMPTDTRIACIWELYMNLATEWELLGMFFVIHNIEPNWWNCNGTYNEKYENGTYHPPGCMGQV